MNNNNTDIITLQDIEKSEITNTILIIVMLIVNIINLAMPFIARLKLRYLRCQSNNTNIPVNNHNGII